MISQETKDQIEKEALKEYPVHYGHYTFQGDYIQEAFDANAHNRAAFIRFSTKYAEKLEEKDKAYNKLGVKFDKEVERWQERDANEVEKRRVLESEIERLKYDLDASVKALVETCKKQDHELAQLKEFQIWFYKKQFGFETDKSAQSNIDSDYAEWCKQNLK